MGSEMCIRDRGSDITDGGLAKQAAVFTIELTRAFVSNFKGHSRRVHIIGEHPRSRGLQSNLLLVLKRTHCGERSEMVVKSGDSHARNLRKFFNAKWHRIVRFNPGDRFGRAVTLIS